MLHGRLITLCHAIVLFSRRTCFCYDEAPWQPVYDYYHIDLGYTGGHHGGLQIKAPEPRDVMVDVINDLGVKLLAIHNEHNENNIGISPYGALSMLAALTEGIRGDAAKEIIYAAHIPKDKQVMRVGLRDIHRHLKSYFIPQEGFLAGLTLNLNNVSLRSEYADILRFYGFDYESFNNALYPGSSTVSTPSDEKTTTLETTLGLSEATTEIATTKISSETTTIKPNFTENRFGIPMETTSIMEDITSTVETTVEGRTTPETTVSVSDSTTGLIKTTQPIVETTTIPSSSTIKTTSTPVATIIISNQESTSIPVAQTTQSLITTDATTTESMIPTTGPKATTMEIQSNTKISESPLTTPTVPVNTESSTISTLKDVTTQSLETATNIQETTATAPTTTLLPTITTKLVTTTTEFPTSTVIITIPTTSKKQTTTTSKAETTPTSTTTEKTTTAVTRTTRDLTKETTTEYQITTVPSSTTTSSTSTSLTTSATTTSLTTMSSKTITPTTMPPTTMPPTTIPSTTMPPTTMPPTTIPPITMPPTIMPPTTMPPTTMPLITIPPTTMPPTTMSPTTMPPTTMPPTTMPPTTLPPTTMPPTIIPPTTATNLSTVMSNTETETNTTVSMTIPDITTEAMLITQETSTTTIPENAPETSSPELFQQLQDFETTTPFFFDTSPQFQDMNVFGQNNFEFNYNYDGNVPQFDNNGTSVQGTPLYDEASSDLLNDNILGDQPSTGFNGNVRRTRSISQYIMKRFYEHNTNHYLPPQTRPYRPYYIPQEPLTFAVYGKYRETGIHFMKYDTVLPFFFVANLNALALSFPLDSSKYYLLLLLPIDYNGIDQLICDLRLHGNFKFILENLRLTHVIATIPSFTLKGYVTLTPTLQQLGVRRIFEPRQADFSAMTNATDIYVTNIEQAVTVTIRNYLDPAAQSYKNFRRFQPVHFKADHPFLYFVMDTELNVALMVGKVVNPLNSRIR